jgi:phosphoribosylglycinamide formyltransferase-1
VIVLQKTVPVLSGDDELSLAARIIVQEHAAYAEAIDRVLSGKYRFAGRRFVTAQTETE